MCQLKGIAWNWALVLGLTMVLSGTMALVIMLLTLDVGHTLFQKTYLWVVGWWVVGFFFLLIGVACYPGGGAPEDEDGDQKKPARRQRRQTTKLLARIVEEEEQEKEPKSTKYKTLEVRRQRPSQASSNRPTKKE